MTDLITKINKLKRQPNLSNVIKTTLDSFNKFKKTGTNEALFSELCYCILTANCHAQTCLNIQHSFKYCFAEATEEQIKSHLQSHHYRFPNLRTQYILDAQKYKDRLTYIIKKNSTSKRRHWFVDNIKGLGMKEASHFLRNIGYTNYAIVDTHILRLLHQYQIIKKPKTITIKTYLHIERKLIEIANQTDLNLAALDLYLWYMQTGMVLK